MSQLDDLTAAVTALQGDVTSMATAVNLEISQLTNTIQALQNANPAVDLSPLMASVANIDAAVKAVTASATAATAPPPPAPPPSA